MNLVLNKDGYDFLKELQHELLTQETDCQASPRYWSLTDYKWVVTDEGYHDRCSVYDINSCESMMLDEYFEDLVNGKIIKDISQEQIEEIDFIYEYESEENFVDWINENLGVNCRLIYETEVSFIVPNTMFLTKEEAKKHIEINHYHYTSKVHTYAMTAWRAPKVERLLNILETIKFEEEIQ